MKEAGNPATLQDATAHLEREKTRALFRNKYDTMLHIVESIVLIHVYAASNQKREGMAKELDEVKSLIDQTRSNCRFGPARKDAAHQGYRNM